PEWRCAADFPVEIVVGALDDQALPEPVRETTASIPKGRYRVLDGVAHYTFLAPCTWRGRWFVPELCADPPGVGNRRSTHRRVATDARAFFDQQLAAAAPRSETD
ncbi:MAG: hypothetical protein AAFX94_01815, partial [Myxococcota bacterium]